MLTLVALANTTGTEDFGGSFERAMEDGSLGRLDCQTRSPLANSSMLLPESAEVSSSFAEIGGKSSAPLISSHCLASRRRTRYHSPRSFSPLRMKCSLPPPNSLPGSELSASKVPQSQTMTAPPPYWPLGIV